MLEFIQNNLNQYKGVAKIRAKGVWNTDAKICKAVQQKLLIQCNGTWSKYFYVSFRYVFIIIIFFHLYYYLLFCLYGQFSDKKNSFTFIYAYYFPLYMCVCLKPAKYGFRLKLSMYSLNSSVPCIFVSQTNIFVSILSTKNLKWRINIIQKKTKWCQWISSSKSDFKPC